MNPDSGKRAHPPPRPSARQEAVAQRLFLALAPRLRGETTLVPPARFAPFDLVRVPSRRGSEGLAATWFPAPGGRRGTVLLLPPWLAVGRAYFHHRGRVQALRAAGYGVLTVDLPRRRRGGCFFDLDLEDTLDYLARRRQEPIHLWGVSSGGYWAHPVLARTDIVAGAFFEDVSPHLLEWSRRTAPWGRPCYAFFRRVLPGAYRFLDMRAHAAAAAAVGSVAAVTYVSGGDDRGVRPGDTLALARAAGGRRHVVAGARHLGAIKTDRRRVVDLALATFERAVATPAPPSTARELGVYPPATGRRAASSRSTSSAVL